MPKWTDEDSDACYAEGIAETIRIKRTGVMSEERRRQLLSMTELGRRLLEDRPEPIHETPVWNGPQPTLPSPSVGLSTGKPMIVYRDTNARFQLQSIITDEVRRLGAVTAKSKRFVRQGRKVRV